MFPPPRPVWLLAGERGKLALGTLKNTHAADSRKLLPDSGSRSVRSKTQIPASLRLITHCFGIAAPGFNRGFAELSIINCFSLANSPGRNLIVCCDGTNNQLGIENTNVIRLVQILDRYHAKQRLYYQPGIGTLPEPDALTRWWTKFYEWEAGNSTPRVIPENALIHESALKRLRKGSLKNETANISDTFKQQVSQLTSVPVTLPYASGNAP